MVILVLQYDAILNVERFSMCVCVQEYEWHESFMLNWTHVDKTI